MPRVCCVDGCGHRFVKRSAQPQKNGLPYLSFHRFPSKNKPELAAAWNEALKNANPKWSPPREPYICSDHFKESDFITCANFRKLRDNIVVVPSIFKEVPSNFNRVKQQSEKIKEKYLKPLRSIRPKPINSNEVNVQPEIFEESSIMQKTLDKSLTNEFKFQGLMAPVFTPFLNDGKFTLDLGVIPEYSKFLDSNDVHGILVNGTTGEGTSMSVEEREEVTAAWVSARKKLGIQQTIIVHVGGAPLLDVQRLAAHAEKLGVDAIMCLHDLFHRPANVGELVEYLQLVGQAAPNTPLFYYHLPAFTGINLSMSALLEQGGTKIPTLTGIKFTSNDLQELGRCLAMSRPEGQKYCVFLGCDDLLLPAYAMGSYSAIATTLNMLAKLSWDIVAHMNPVKSDLLVAADYQRALSAAVRSITRGGPWVSTMKAAMNALTPIQVGPPRPPLKSASAEHIQAMMNELAVIKERGANKLGDPEEVGTNTVLLEPSLCMIPRYKYKDEKE